MKVKTPVYHNYRNVKWKVIFSQACAILFTGVSILVGGWGESLSGSVLVLLKFQVNSQRSWSSGTTKFWVWIGNCNVKVWKSTEHKLHKMWNSNFLPKFRKTSTPPGSLCWWSLPGGSLFKGNLCPGRGRSLSREISLCGSLSQVSPSVGLCSGE